MFHMAKILVNALYNISEVLFIIHVVNYNQTLITVISWGLVTLCHASVIREHAANKGCMLINLIEQFKTNSYLL